MTTQQFQLLASVLTCCLMVKAGLARDPLESNAPRLVAVPQPAVFEEVERTANAIDEATRKLLSLLNDESADPGHRQQAIRSLERLRSRAAIRPLLRQLLFKSVFVSAPGPLASFPAAEALTQYGRDVYPEMWGELGEEHSDDYLYVLSFTLQAMDGKEVSIVRVNEKLGDPSATPEQKRNAARLREMLVNSGFGNPLTWPRHRHPKPPAVPKAMP